MTNWSGLFNHVHSGGHELIGTRQAEVAIGRALKPYGRGAFRRILRTLVGASAGATATQAHVRVAAQNDGQVGDLGGVRAVESTLLVNRATTADDVTAMHNAIDYPRLSNFPADKSGNGGGGKLGY